MKDAAQYPVTDRYGATYSPWSKSSPHLGDDRSMPLGTPVLVNRVLIGKAGTTGKSSGPHTHTQKVQGGRVVDPKGGGFSVPSPVIVVSTGFRSDIGNYVRYKDGSGVTWSIFHFDSVNVKAGDILMGEKNVNLTEADTLYLLGLRRHIDKAGQKTYVGNYKWIDLANLLRFSEEFKIQTAKLKDYDRLKKENANLKKQTGDSGKIAKILAIIKGD